MASYGKIISSAILEIPKFNSINVHPSLLPFYRGASPIESAMLDDTKETGVTIMLMDADMDHGPILNQEVVFFENWPSKVEVEKTLAVAGGKLLAETIPLVVDGSIDEQEQDHEMATFTSKISKEMGLLEFNTETQMVAGDDYQNFLKIQALNPWPGTYFFIKRKDTDLRVKITEASFEGDALQILKVIPAGKSEMSWDDFKKGFLN